MTMDVMFTERWDAKTEVKKDKYKQQKRIDEKNRRRRIQQTGTVPYLFKSKIKAYQKQNPNVQYQELLAI